MSIKSESKSKLINEYSRSEKDTGSPEVQIAILTERITNLTGHFQSHKKGWCIQIGGIIAPRLGDPVPQC